MTKVGWGTALFGMGPALLENIVPNILLDGSASGSPTQTLEQTADVNRQKKRKTWDRN